MGFHGFGPRAGPRLHQHDVEPGRQRRNPEIQYVRPDSVARSYVSTIWFLYFVPDQLRWASHLRAALASHLCLRALVRFGYNRCNLGHREWWQEPEHQNEL